MLNIVWHKNTINSKSFFNLAQRKHTGMKQGVTNNPVICHINVHSVFLEWYEVCVVIGLKPK